jgi:hypothetical protein
MAVGFNNGEGIPVVNPWQINREGKAAAAINEYYSLNHLSDTSEIEKSSDIIMALLRDTDSDGTFDPNQIRFQFLKLRDAAFPPIKTVGIDFRTCYFGARDTHALSLSASPEEALGIDLDDLGF